MPLTVRRFPLAAISTVTFEVLVNGKTISGSYPDGEFNGLLKLGEFENEPVTVKARAKKDITLRSLGVAAINTNKLLAAAESAHTVNFTRKGGMLTGSINRPRRRVLPDKPSPIPTV